MRDWRFAAASVLGTSHLRHGLPCQDSHACRAVTDGDGRTALVLAVSDGAGSAARAEEGSAIACEILVRAVEARLAATRVDRLEAADALDWLARVRAAISSILAPERPFSANSASATSRMSRCVPSGSCTRLPADRRRGLEGRGAGAAEADLGGRTVAVGGD